MSGQDISSLVLRVLAEVPDSPAGAFQNGTTVLQDAGLDSLGLLQVVNTLQDQLGIVVPDEVTARVRTVADLQQAVADLAAAAPATPPTRTGS